MPSTTSTTPPNDNPSSGETAAQPEGTTEMATATKTAPARKAASTKTAPNKGPVNKGKAAPAKPAAKQAPAKAAAAKAAPAATSTRKGLAYDEAMSSTARTKEERYKDNARAVRELLRENGYDVRAVSRARINAFAWFPIMSDGEAKTIDKLLATTSCPFVATNVTPTRVYIQFTDRV